MLRRDSSCSRAQDLILVLDSSSSWGELGWSNVKQYAAAIVDVLPVSLALTQFVDFFCDSKDSNIALRF